LVEIVAGSVKLSDRDQRRVANFNLRFKVLRTSELAKQQAALSSSAAKLKP
jgi:type IV pilus assembly protein PilN